jgi:hypothetical protein
MASRRRGATLAGMIFFVAFPCQIRWICYQRICGAWKATEAFFTAGLP